MSPTSCAATDRPVPRRRLTISRGVTRAGARYDPGAMRGPNRSIHLPRAVVVQALLGSVLVVLAVALAGSLTLRRSTALVGSPLSNAESTVGFLLVLGALSVVFLCLAGLVAWVTSRHITGDVEYVTEGVGTMARRGTLRDPIPIRSLDEVGELTRRFEMLRSHFIGVLEREREARRRAEEADRYRTEFLTTVSHELRTPLNGILGFTDVLLNEIEGPLTTAQREDLQVIRASGAHLMRLFNDVLDLSAASSGHLRLDRGKVEVPPLLEGLAAELEGQTDGRSVAIRVQLGDDLPTVFADVDRLRRILTNLASNALKHTEQGEVVLAATADGDAVRFDVRDTGPGIPADQLPSLFEEFVQVGDERRRRGGAGLGLTISKQLAELHDGSLEVQSRVGEGSTFTVRIPRWREA